MATLLKYENGLLLPVQGFISNENYSGYSKPGVVVKNHANTNDAFKKVLNILILLTVAINTIVTIAVAARLS